MNMERSSGILMHISSLPSACGIGTLGKAAYRYADFLKRAGQKYWQVLPIGPTGCGNSPYQSFSTYAGNPYFIDLDMLAEEGLLSPNDYTNIDWGDDPARVDYGKIYENRFNVLRKAFENGSWRDAEAVGQFLQDKSGWIHDYALFMALKNHLGMLPWNKWPDEGAKLGTAEAREKFGTLLRYDVEFWIYIQYLFYKQWYALKQYVNALGIRIIGDVPIYVAQDSSDIWANPGIFWLDAERNPVCVAGCPPDYFSATGQLWGNPLYDWASLKKSGYQWWMQRIAALREIFDVIRIDHFRGFEAFYAIPRGEETAQNGTWIQGPGIDFFNALRQEMGEVPIIAEDLGFLTPEVRRLLDDTGYPGMKVLQFAFDSREPSDYLPHNYNRNCVVYTGTHDNDTGAGWFTSVRPEDAELAKEYLRLTSEEGYSWGLVRGALSSVADLAVAQMQDFLELPGEARMNIPSTLGGRNWQWRMAESALTDALAERIGHMTRLYGR